MSPGVRSETLESRWLMSALGWSSGPALPLAISNDVALLQSDGTINVVGPTTASPGTILTETPGNPAFSVAGYLPGTRTNYGVAADGYNPGVYVVGGRLNNAVTGTVYYYDQTTGTTTSMPTLSEPRELSAAVSTGYGTLWSIGGKNVDGHASAAVELLSNGSWDNTTNLPQAEYGMGVATDGYGTIYVAGGMTSSGLTNKVFALNGTGQTWTTYPTMPLAVRNPTVVYSPVIDKLYVIGGVASTGTTSEVQSYDFARGTWKVDVALPVSLSGAGSYVDANNMIHVIGGANASGQAMATEFISSDTSLESTPPLFYSTPPTSGDPGTPYVYTAYADGVPAPTYSLVTAPSDMSIDPVTGIVTWTPEPAELGTVNMDVRASNDAGTADQIWSVTVADHTPPSTPTGLISTPLTTATATVSWQPSTDNVAIASYSVFVRTVVHGRSSSTVTYTKLADLTGTSIVLGPTGNTQTIVVIATDTSGNSSAYSAGVAVVPGIAAGLTFFSSPYSITANHLLTITPYATGNPTPSFTLVSAPAGMTMDPATGTLTWVPGATAVGTTSVTIQDTNAFGTATATASITVNPDVPVVVYTVNNPPGFTNPVVSKLTTIQLTDYSYTPSTFTLVSGPVGMAFNTTTNLASWTPTADEAGINSAVFTAVNSAGSETVTVPLNVSLSDAPSHLVLAMLAGSTAQFSWSLPTIAAPISYYQVAAVRFAGFINFQPVYVTTLYNESGGATSSATLNSLVAGSYTFTVTPFDAAGHPGLVSNTVAATIAATVTAPTVYASPQGDSLAMRLDPSNAENVQLFVNTPESGTPTLEVPLAQLGSFTYAGNTGNDILTVDFSAGNPLPPGGISYTGGGVATYTPGDKLVILGNSAGGMGFTLTSTGVTTSVAPASPITTSSITSAEFDLAGGGNSLTQNAQTYSTVAYDPGSGSNALTINSGSFTLSTDPMPSGNLLSVQDNANVIFAAGPAGGGIHPIHLASLVVSASATAVMSAPASQADRSVLVLPQLLIDPAGKLDVSSNDLIVQSTPANADSDLGTVNGYLASSAASGWAGYGIGSSAVSLNTANSTALGVLLNNTDPGGSNTPLYTTFDGVNVSPSDLLVKYTYEGDANLDGVVNGSDYTRIDNGFNNGLADWANGDFNYDGVVNGSDYTLIDNSFNTQGQILASPATDLAGTIIRGAASKSASTPVFSSVNPIPTDNSGGNDWFKKHKASAGHLLTTRAESFSGLE